MTWAAVAQKGATQGGRHSPARSSTARRGGSPGWQRHCSGSGGTASSPSAATPGAAARRLDLARGTQRTAGPSKRGAEEDGPAGPIRCVHASQRSAWSGESVALSVSGRWAAFQTGSWAPPPNKHMLLNLQVDPGALRGQPCSAAWPVCAVWGVQAVREKA